MEPRWIHGVDQILSHQPGQAAPLRLTRLVTCAVLGGVVYGAVMGSYSGLSLDRCQLLFFAASKVPLLTLGAFVLSLPSFFVINTLLGLRDDFGRSLRGLAATQASLAVVLAALAPFTATYYASTTNYSSAVVFNGLMFLIATAAAQLVLRRHYTPLIAENLRHVWMLRGWLIIYWFVAIQLAWLLRPFVGDPNSRPEFFRPDVLAENAYVVVVKLAWRVFVGR